MSKTYSVAIKGKSGDWFTNWGQYFSLDDINWQDVKDFVTERGDLGYGYYYGHKSRSLTSTRCRTVLWESEAAV